MTTSWKDHVKDAQTATDAIEKGMLIQDAQTLLMGAQVHLLTGIALLLSEMVENPIHHEISEKLSIISDQLDVSRL